MDIVESLSRKLNIQEVKTIASRIGESEECRVIVLQSVWSNDRRKSVNALWVLTHLSSTEQAWLAEMQDEFINRLLVEQDGSRKRLLLQILRHQEFDAENPKVIKLLDYCMPKINAECEPYAVRCFSLYVAFKICRPFPELIDELKGRMELLSFQSLSPGLRSAARQIHHKLSRLK